MHRSSPARRLRIAGVPTLDALLAGALVVVAVLDVAGTRAAAHPWGEIVAVVWMASLVLRTVWPAGTVVVCSAGAVVYLLVPGVPVDGLWAFVAVLVVAFTLGSRMGTPGWPLLVLLLVLG